MKLNPPASSSDLEVARQIARRLHQHRRRADQGANSRHAEETPARSRLTPPPLPPRPAPAEPPEEPLMRAEAPPAPPPPPARREAPPPARVLRPEPSFDLPEAPAFEPSWSEPEPVVHEPAPLEDLASPDEQNLFTAHHPQLAREPAPVEVDVDERPLSPEELVGEGAEASPLDGLTDPEPSPFDDALLDAAPVTEEPGPPLWDEIVENCRDLAQAQGAMIVDSAGQVFSARGDWPAPGPDAIATKLVTMMAKTLKDAPTRSISAPLMGKHLTAWRVSLNEGLVTAVFIGAAPVRADARPAIDAEIHRGAGA